MKKLHHFTFCIIILLVFAACSSNSTEGSIEEQKPLQTPDYHTWADTILTDVYIKSTDTANDWENFKVRKVNQEMIVDDLFDMVYDGTKQAYIYMSDEKLSKKDVKDLEATEEFDRSRVGKLMFEEEWRMDVANQKLQKKVLSITVGYSVYTDSMKLRGYKAAFTLRDL